MRISDYADGMIANWGTHLNDVAQWANGTERTGPVHVEGTGEFSKGLWNTITSFDLQYRFANGVQLFYKLDRPYVRFEGTEGWVEATYPDGLTASTPSILSSPIGSGEISFAGTLSDKEDFIHAIKNGGETLEPVEVGHRTVSICQIGLIAATLGYPLTWDPGQERFTDNAANAMLTIPTRPEWDI
jgi:predicted dehydrogenase